MASLYDGAGFRFRSAGDFAQLGLRSAIIANGGALIAVLTFVGNASSVIVQTEWIWLTFAAFVLGLMAALTGALCAYQTQSDYGRQQEAGADKIFFHSINDEKNAALQDAEETRYMRAGAKWEWAGISCFVLSLVFFMFGSAFGILALGASSIWPTQTALSAMSGYLSIVGLVLELIGAIMAGLAMSTKMPKDIPPPTVPLKENETRLFINSDQAQRGLWLIAGGALLQIADTAISLLTNGNAN